MKVAALFLPCLLAAALLGSLPHCAHALGTTNGKPIHLIPRPIEYRHSANPHAERAAMGWKDAGRTIPMNGGLYTVGGYFMNVTVGTGAGQITFNAIVDTGSSNTAIPSIGCARCQAAALYNSSASPTSRKLYCVSEMCQNCKPTEVSSDAVPRDSANATCLYGPPVCVGDQCAFAISYGGTSSGLMGTTVTDYACLGDSLCAHSVYINEITNEFPTGTQPTGIIGFAFPHNACNPTCTPTILDSFAARGTIPKDQNGFGMCTSKRTGGKMDVGYLNETRYAKGSMKYTRVVTKWWYNIVVKDFLINGQSIGVPQYMYGIVNDGIGAFVDSGTSIVIVSPYAFQKIQALMLTNYANLTGATALFGPQSQCVTLSNAQRAAYPVMEFVLEGMSRDGSDDFTVGMDGTNYLTPAPSGQPETYCLGIAGVASIGAILGDVIMTNYYIAFDRSGSRLGFAPILNCD
jgi:hypothetical protein